MGSRFWHRRIRGLTGLRGRLIRRVHGHPPYYGLFAAHPDAIFHLSGSGRVEEMNARASALTGLTLAQMRRVRWHSLVAESDRSQSLGCFDRALQGQAGSFHSLLTVQEPGREFLARVTYVPASGPMGGVFCIVRDRTLSATRDLRLHQSWVELRRLNKVQDNVRETERRRIARDLHDEMGQTLSALKLDLGQIIEDLPKLSDDHIRRLDAVLEFVDDTIEQIREIAANLRPAMLDELGFEAAAEWFLQRCNLRQGLEVQWTVDGDESGQLEMELATALYRVLQECMTNVARHAGASQVQVHYRVVDTTALLTVQDDGAGFDISSQPVPGIGLIGMRERVAMLGGTFTINSSLHQGTRVAVSLPLGSSANND